MSRIFHCNRFHRYPTAVRGAGVYLFDSSGKPYLDASGGAAVSCLGHAHPAVIAAIQRQAGQLCCARTGAFTSEPAEALARHRIANAPAGISHAVFVSGGGEAMGTALKLGRQYFLERGEPARSRFCRAPPELPRQHPGGVGDWRRRRTARRVCAHADGCAACEPVRPLSRAARRRVADPRRGDMWHGPPRYPVCVRSRRRGSRHPDDCEGPVRRPLRQHPYRLNV